MMASIESVFVPISDPSREPLLMRPNGRDGRRMDEPRKLFMKCGAVTGQAKGSAYMEAGSTKILCTVFGPREIPRSDEMSSSKGIIKVSVKQAPFATKRRAQRQRKEQPLSEESQLAQALTNAFRPAVCLSKFPKAQIEIYVTVLEDDGSVLATALTCVSLALSDAAIDMYDLVIGASALLCNNYTYIDPTSSEEHESKKAALLTLGFMPSLQQVAHCSQHGQIMLNEVMQALKHLTAACSTVYPIVRDCIARSVVQQHGQ